MFPRQSTQQNSRPFYFLLIGLCLFFALTYTSRLMELGREEARLQEWQGKVERAKQEQLRLNAHRTYVQSDAYVEQISRRELGLSQPGDTMIVILPDTSRPSVETEVIPLQIEPNTRFYEPIWREWLSLFSQKQ